MANDVMRVFNATHVWFGNVDIQLRQRAKLSAVTSGKRQRSATYRIRVFHRADNIGRISGTADRHVDVARLREIFELFDKRILVAHVIRIRGHGGNRIVERLNAKTRGLSATRAFDHVAHEVRRRCSAATISETSLRVIGSWS